MVFSNPSDYHRNVKLPPRSASAPAPPIIPIPTPLPPTRYSAINIEPTRKNSKKTTVLGANNCSPKNYVVMDGTRESRDYENAKLGGGVEKHEV